MPLSIIYDIETAPLPEEQLRAVLPPFEFDPPPGEFLESSVKLGNTKDPVKVKEKIDDARKKHDAAVASYSKDRADAEEAHWLKFVEKAALDASSGRIVAIGYRRQDENGKPVSKVAIGDERVLIEGFWKLFKMVAADPDGKLIGFNSQGFDLPFIIRRSWILDIPVPDSVFPDRYWSRAFIDLMRKYLFGMSHEYVKLDRVSQLLGCGGKEGVVEGVCGANVWKFLESHDQAERAKGIAYVEVDLDRTWKVAERMGVV